MKTKLSFEPQFTTPSLWGDCEEVVHTFHIDWLGDDIVFESTFMDVMCGLQQIMQNIWDYQNTIGVATVATFFKAMYRTDIIEEHPETREYGWCVDSLADWDCTWLPFLIEKRKNARNDYDIRTFVYPNENLREVLHDYGSCLPDEEFYEL